MNEVKQLNNIDFHKKQMKLIGAIISGIEAQRAWYDLMASGINPDLYPVDQFLDERKYFQQMITGFQKHFLASQQALEAAGLDWLDSVETPAKLAQKQLEWEKSMGIRRFTRRQYFWRRLFSNQWKRIN
jgi:hypothetical protein